MGNFFGETQTSKIQTEDPQTQKQNKIKEQQRQQEETNKRIKINEKKKETEFQLKLFKELSKQPNNLHQNVIISPLSIYLALSLVACGAKDQTLQEMTNTLSTNTSIEEIKDYCSKMIQYFASQTYIKIATAVLTNSKTTSAFEECCKQFDSSNYQLKSVDQVNNWIAEKTDNKITHIIDNINDINLLILNAVYILCDWKTPFEELGTLRHYPHLKGLKFTNSEGISFEWTFMRDIQNSVAYYEDSSCKAVQLDYKNDLMKALVILPKESTLDEYLKGFNSFELSHITSSLKQKKIMLILPEFEVEFNTDLNHVFDSMGMSKAFKPKEANFGNLIEGQDSHIDKIIHKTYLKVDKIGTKGGAMTDLPTIGCVPPDMAVCKPFLFLIIHKNYPSHCIFMAKINDVRK